MEESESSSRDDKLDNSLCCWGSGVSDVEDEVDVSTSGSFVRIFFNGDTRSTSPDRFLPVVCGCQASSLEIPGQITSRLTPSGISSESERQRHSSICLPFST
jgi:hypothetical protein